MIVIELLMQSDKGREIILSFILLNYNNVNYTIPCIESIKNVVKVAHEIIVVDNGSTDNSIERLSGISGITLVKNKTNRGFTGGNNDGAKVARGKYLVVLNNDTVLEDERINELPIVLDSLGRYDVVGGKLVGVDDKPQPSGGYEPYPLFLFLQFTVLCYKKFSFPWLKRFYFSEWMNDRIQKVDWASGCFFAMRRDTFIELGGFDENIFIYLDEVDLHKRARYKGGNVYLYPQFIIKHYGQVSWGSKHYIGLRHNYNSAVYYLGKYRGLSYKFFFIISVKLVNLIYLPFLSFLNIIKNNVKLKNKLKFCLTLITA
ncbi:MAG: hypothetical protein Fur0020_00200 [Thermodesulfovibrionia bacterium]